MKKSKFPDQQLPGSEIQSTHVASGSTAAAQVRSTAAFLRTF